MYELDYSNADQVYWLARLAHLYEEEEDTFHLYILAR